MWTRTTTTCATRVSVPWSSEGRCPELTACSLVHHLLCFGFQATSIPLDEDLLSSFHSMTIIAPPGSHQGKAGEQQNLEGQQHGQQQCQEQGHQRADQDQGGQQGHTQAEQDQGGQQGHQQAEQDQGGQQGHQQCHQQSQQQAQKQQGEQQAEKQQGQQQREQQGQQQVEQHGMQGQQQGPMQGPQQVPVDLLLGFLNGQLHPPSSVFSIIINASGCDDVDMERLAAARGACPTGFLVLWHKDATENPKLRTDAFSRQANMVTFSEKDIKTALKLVVQQEGGGHIECEFCGLRNLSATDIWLHQPLYHIYRENKVGACQICNVETSNLAVHIHEVHNPAGASEEFRGNTGSAIVVHRKEDSKFLMVQEFNNKGFWVPGGISDPGETLIECGLRECIEEVGTEVELLGLLEIQTYLNVNPPWRLAVFYAVPKDSKQPPKTLPNFESAGSCWVSVEDLAHIPLRCDEIPSKWFARLADGCEVPPLTISPDQIQVLKMPPAVEFS